MAIKNCFFFSSKCSSETQLYVYDGFYKKVLLCLKKESLEILFVRTNMIGERSLRKLSGNTRITGIRTAHFRPRKWEKRTKNQKIYEGIYQNRLLFFRGIWPLVSSQISYIFESGLTCWRCRIKILDFIRLLYALRLKKGQF